MRAGGWVVVLSLLLFGCGADETRIRACQAVLAAFEPDPAALEIAAAESPPGDAQAVRLLYRAPRDDGRHWILCRFAGATGAARYEIAGVSTDRTGPLDEVRMTLLRIALSLPQPLPTGVGLPDRADARPSLALDLLYLLQQMVNAVVLSAVYALLATGYTLVYGVVRRVNLAFGALHMAGAYVSVIAIVLLGMMGVAYLPLLPLVLLLAMAAVAVQGWVLEWSVFRPTRQMPGQAPLVASLGLAIALSEAVRLLQGARDRWLPPPFAGSHVLAEVPGFAVTITTTQILVVMLVAVLAGGLLLLLRRTALGRALRACADDPAAAALMGLDVNRTVAAAFALSGAFAAAAGFVVALHYGGVNFFMGWAIGFKALVAAVVGGIGSVPGALLGGLLIGLTETLWTGYFDIAQKDVAIFTLLAAFLIFRPHGLLGLPRSRGD